MIQIGHTTDTETCFALRHAVFVAEQGYTAEGEVDALDAQSLHLLARDGDTPIATARVYLDEGTAKIGRVCVLKERRGEGLGAQVIKAALELAVTHSASRAVLGAQVQAIGFYEKLGFTPFGDVYADEGEPHQMMEQRL
ncbi:GNAT family N-acetyltransferase [Sulfitobacter sp. HNIBRBA2951]|uniref:GNAT family N-acetyltransferase n=1 Tax=Sulfitobacter aquimarinus TaxID=3158557 RepID=UPI0032DE889F